jgi:hypothetical protein
MLGLGKGITGPGQVSLPGLPGVIDGPSPLMSRRQWHLLQALQANLNEHSCMFELRSCGLGARVQLLGLSTILV